MLIQCPICTELFTESSSILGLQCGHIFHEACLLKWLDNKCNCPQCRSKCKRTSGFKVYLSLSSTSNYSQYIDDGEQSAKLSEELALANVQLKEKSLANALLVEESNRHKERYKDLNDRLKKFEERLKHEESQKSVLQSELRTAMTSLGSTSRENLELRKKVEHLGNVQLVINGSEEEIESLISTATDPKQLSIWCTVYRKELEKKKMDLRLSLDASSRFRKKAESEKARCDGMEMKMKQLEEDDVSNKEVISGLEMQVKSLTKKVVSLQASIDSPRHTSKSLIHRLLHESPAPMNVSNLDDTFATPVTSRKLPVPMSFSTQEEPIVGDKEKARKRKKSDDIEVIELDKSESVSNESSSSDKQIVDVPRKKAKQEIQKPVRNPLLDLGIFKRHNSGGILRPSAFLTSSSSSNQNGKDTMVVRKGYNGFGGHEKYVGPSLRRENSNSSNSQPNVAVRKNLGPSTNSLSQPSMKKLFSSSSSSYKCDALF